MTSGGAILTFFLWVNALSAQLVFQKTDYLIDIPADAEEYKISCPFSVSGETELVEIDEKCSCITGSFKPEKTSWKASENGVLELILDTGQIKGSTSKTVDLHFKNHPTQSLTVKARVPIALTSDVKTQKWSIGEAANPKSYKIKISPEFDFELETISRSSTVFDFELIPHEQKEGEGKSYTFTVTPNDLSAKAFCLFKIETDSKISRYKSISLMALIQE